MWSARDRNGPGRRLSTDQYDILTGLRDNLTASAPCFISEPDCKRYWDADAIATTNHDVAFLGRASPTLHSAGSIDEDEDSDDEGSDLHPFAHSSIIHADTTTMASASQYLLQSGSLIKPSSMLPAL
jgi:hypothetical protein